MTDAPTFDVVAARSKALVDRLLADRGEAGKAAREEAKKLFPDAQIVDPNADIEPVVAPLKAQLEALQAQIAERDAKEAEAQQKALEQRAETEFQSKLDATTKQFGLTPDGVAAVLERMKATGNYASPEDAAAFVLKDYKPVETRSAALGPQAADFLGKASQEDADRMKLLWNDPDGAFLDYEISKMEADPDQYARAYAPEFFQN